jgi:hypothetical protein
LNNKTRALASAALDRDAAAMRFGKAFDQRQPDAPATFAASFCLG